MQELEIRRWGKTEENSGGEDKSIINIFFKTMRFEPLVASSLFLLTTIIAINAKKKLKEQDIIQRALKDYDWRVRPRGNNQSWPGGQLFFF